jgi:hypothetical protein
MKNLFNKFFEWYERHYTLNLTITTFLFLLQLVHLYWLTTHVVLQKLVGRSFFDPNSFWELVIIFVDYTEIPAIITTSILYINELRKGYNRKSLLLLLALNSQWLHLFWITDEIVLEQFTGAGAVVFPMWLAFVAIFIDYLELPVIYDTLKKTYKALKKKYYERTL